MKVTKTSQEVPPLRIKIAADLAGHMAKEWAFDERHFPEIAKRSLALADTIIDLHNKQQNESEKEYVYDYTTKIDR